MRNAAIILTIAAASALLLVGWRRYRSIESYTGAADIAPDWGDELSVTLNGVRNLAAPVAGMQPSSALRLMLKGREKLSLKRYRLGDGGWTIGYGRYFPDGGDVPPERINAATAEAWFEQDIEQRGARWVRAYVAVPLTQYQFDALVHMAYNLSPKSFRNIAEAVNRGEDPEFQALRYVRAGSDLEAGLRNRRAEEIRLYRQGIYV